MTADLSLNAGSAGRLALSEPVNFVIPARFAWPELDDPVSIPDETLAQRCTNAMCNWVIIPYIYFKRASLPATRSFKPLPGVINIVTADDLGLRERPISAFIVSCRADAHLPEIANFVFEQNMARRGAPNVAWTAHWPQPALIARDAERGSRLETLAYKGDVTHNLWRGFYDTAFRDALARLGVRLRIDPTEAPPGEGLRLHDYAEVDAVIAVRNLTNRDILTKPASKLVNAWLAGVPALLGVEPAYRELRQSPLDYIEIQTPEDALTAIARLKGDPDLYDRMRANAVERAQAFTVNALLRRWVDLLNGPVAAAHAEWRARSFPAKAARWAAAAVRERQSKARAKRNRTAGIRPFGDQVAGPTN